VGMCSGPNSSSAVGLRKDTAGGTGSVLLLGKLFPDGSSAVSDTGVLGTGVIDECGSSGRLGISTQSSSPESEEVPSDELLSISSTSIGCLVSFGTDAKNPLILADPAAALRKVACFLKMFARLVPW